MKKVLIVCGNGLGSSFIVDINVKKLLAELGLQAEVAHTDLTSASSERADLILAAQDIADRLVDHPAHVVGLSNLLDNAKIKQVLAENLSR
ncbi:PTS sugar transporter subunit IIB [Pantoea sp. 1.19]|uniref:PTS sugar transporter subunit IIB n=1 Tax=Pantoea sp. 1.19 TaxID=1925589 RepID=UPI000948AA3D|nr:PTS sugar transporter subunit IIB [Pantoea sp. 1.19]